MAIAYIRVSTSDQKLGPEAQRAAIEAWAAREGVQVASWHVDAGVSGASGLAERKALLEALAAQQTAKAGILVIAKRDRLARDVVVAAQIEREVARAGGVVISADGTANGASPADAFMRTVIDGAAAYERALIAARTSAALQAKRARGERVSAQLPYGFRLADDGVQLLPEPEEQATIARARELRASGLSFGAISRSLASSGKFSRSGRPFFDMQVARMLAA